jgi:FkbM family methyltransferase
MFEKIIHKITITILSKIYLRKKEVMRLGSNYGGWSIYTTKNLSGGIVVSAGVGEDVTFDIELIEKFGCRVFLIDPTPRAKLHYQDIVERFGKNKKSDEYSQDGQQSVLSYNLENINHNNFIFLNKAVSDKTIKNVKFFEPKNPSHVSHSLIEDLNDNNNYILVDVISFKDLTEQLNLKNIQILKLDIEGSEVDVLKNIFKTGINVEQILVEYDLLRTRKVSAYFKVLFISTKLLLNKYVLVNIEDLNYTFLKKSTLQNQL